MAPIEGYSRKILLPICQYAPCLEQYFSVHGLLNKKKENLNFLILSYVK